MCTLRDENCNEHRIFCIRGGKISRHLCFNQPSKHNVNVFLADNFLSDLENSSSLLSLKNVIDKRSKQNELGAMRHHDMNVLRVENHTNN